MAQNRPSRTPSPDMNPIAFFVDHARKCGYDPMPELKKQAAGAVVRARKAGKPDEVIRRALERAAETRRFDLWGNFVADAEVGEGPMDAWRALCEVVARGGRRIELSPRAQQAWLRAFGPVDHRWINTGTGDRIRFIQAWKEVGTELEGEGRGGSHSLHA